MSGQDQNNKGNNQKNDKSTKDQSKKGDNKSHQKLPPLYLRDPRYWAPDSLGLTECPPNRIELQPGQRHPLILNRQHPATIRPVKDAEHFKRFSAIEQPADGDNVKTDKQRCLTCINSGSRCHGTDVQGGKCRSCRGIPVNSGNTRRARVCLWLDPQRNIFTYADAQRVNATRTIPRNTRPVQLTAANQPEPAAQPDVPGFLDFDPEGNEFEALSNLVASLWDASQFTTNGWTNLVRIRDTAQRQLQQLLASLSAAQLAVNDQARHLRTILSAAAAMLRREDEDQILVPLTLVYLLPQGHPGRNYGTRAEGRGRLRGG